MRWRLAVLAALCVFAASCGGGDDVAVIERQVSASADEDPHTTLCHGVEAFAMGSHAGDDQHRVIDELARLGALLGASEALPHLADMKAALDANEQTARSMDAAAEALDHAAHVECGIPVFTPMYVTTSFASCFGRTPIAAGTMVPDSEGCEPDLGAEFLPCFDTNAGYVPVDCRSGELVVLRAGEWVDA